MTDFLTEKRKEITARQAELKPALDEHARLEEALAALKGIVPSRNGVPAVTPPASARRRGPDRPPGSKTRAAKATPKTPAPLAAVAPAKRSAATRKGGRRKGSGARGAQALALIQTQPGITISELAAKMDIKQNYLYRVVPALEEEGKVRKKGRGWHPRAATQAAA